jgi:hypothetical protein
MDVFKQN